MVRALYYVGAVAIGGALVAGLGTVVNDLCLAAGSGVLDAARRSGGAAGIAGTFVAIIAAKHAP